MAAVSIITPNYNTADFIGETIESVLAQTFDDWEMIIVDDASTDNSREIIQAYADKDKRIKPVFLKENGGQGKARNIATDLASGQYIAFLDSDDIWHPEKLEKHLHFMREKNAVFSYTAYGFIDEKGREILKPYRISKCPLTYGDLLKKNDIGCLTAMYNAGRIGKFFMPDLRKKQDYAMWLSILKKGYMAYPYNEVLAWYRKRATSVTGNKKKLIFEHYKFLRKTEKLSLFNAVFYTFTWGWNGLKKYYINGYL